MVSGTGRVPNSSWSSLISNLIPTLGLGTMRAVLWLFFFGSREENVLALGRQLELHVCIDDIYAAEL